MLNWKFNVKSCVRII